MLNYFHVLGLPPQASLNDIKTAYRKLALVYHPDKNPENSDALQRFREITEAYQTLSAWKQDVIENLAKNSKQDANSNYNFVPYQEALKYKTQKKSASFEQQKNLEKRIKLNLCYKGYSINNEKCPYCTSSQLKKVVSHTELHGISYTPFFLGVVHCDNCGVDFYGIGKKKISETFLQILSMFIGLALCSLTYYFVINNLDKIIGI